MFVESWLVQRVLFPFLRLLNLSRSCQRSSLDSSSNLCPALSLILPFSHFLSSSALSCWPMISHILIFSSFSSLNRLWLSIHQSRTYRFNSVFVPDSSLLWLLRVIIEWECAECRNYATEIHQGAWQVRTPHGEEWLLIGWYQLIGRGKGVNTR